MNSALAALLGLIVAIVLIVRRTPPVYGLMLGALIGGLAAGYPLVKTVDLMISGIGEIIPAVLRILAAGVLSGVLIRTGAAASISRTIVRRLGARHVYLALALATMFLTGTGVFIDVAVITVAPVALMLGRQLDIPKFRLLLAMIAGGKCGNIVSPNPNTIIAAENLGAPLPSVMLANLLPALVGLFVAVYVLMPLAPSRGERPEAGSAEEESGSLPSFAASMAGPLTAIVLLILRPLTGVVIDPFIALPAGGLVGIVATRRWRELMPGLGYGLEKMAPVAVLLIGTGTIAGIIKASAIKEVVLSLLAHWNIGEAAVAPLAGALMSAATASTTAGATIASASFADIILAAGIPAIWGAALVNAGATVLDHLPHGSFFHATGGSVDMKMKERLKMIPYETAVGLILTLASLTGYLIAR